MYLAIRNEPVPFEMVKGMLDSVAHYLGHKADDVLDGQVIPELEGPADMVNVALHGACDSLDAIIELVEQGKLAMVLIRDDQGHVSFTLRIVGYN